MKVVQKYIGAVALLASCAWAQGRAGTATVQNVTVAREGSDLRVEITLSAPVIPIVDTAEKPNRILLDFPDTRCAAAAPSLAVNDNGVRRVRAGQHSTLPLVTRVVVDLDRAHLYSVKSEGNRVILTVVAPDKRAASRDVPVAATSGNLIGIFRRRHNAAPATDTPTDTAPPPPPPAIAGPAFDPAKAEASAAAVPPPDLGKPVPSGQPAAAPQQEPMSPPAFEQTVTSAPVLPAVPNVPAATPATAAAARTPPAAVAGSDAAPVEATGPVESAGTAASLSAGSGAEAVATLIARADDPTLHTVFRVKYVAAGVAYLDGGRSQGLKEGMKLEVIDKNAAATQGDSANAADPRVVAELEVSAVAETSSVTDIHTPRRAVKVGDLAYLSNGDAEALVQQRALSATRQYPAVISFTEGDTLDEEARAEVPRPPLPSVNRARGRIGFDTMETISRGTSNMTSTDLGVVFRGDITRIGGTYWNLSGYWRGRLTKESVASQQTLQSLLNRTYHLNMTYDNPNSTLVAGFGRLYLPWAASLDTIDGGYFGKRLSRGTTLGIFGGSTPDPSSWDYSPDRVMGGAFVNFEGGEYDGVHFSSTAGGGISLLSWNIDRPFLFVEDSLSYKRTFALYESAQIDNPAGNTVAPSPGWGLGRNFSTFRVNPHPRVELDFNYNYFRQIPTFDTNLAALGLLDKYLFQGFSAGGRLEVWNQIWLSTNLGRSSGTGDAKTSLNQMYGITFGRLPWVHLRADAHYAKFDSAFGSGYYKAVSVSRQMSDRLRVEVLLGQQNFVSALTTNTNSKFVTGTVETTLGPHYYLQGNFTTNRGNLSYDQMMFSIGYRFDSRRKRE